MIVVVATKNMGKMREIVAMLGDEGIEWKTLDAFSPVPEPEETGTTFLENATLKARYYARHTGELTLAEDSGLEVDALQGRPGVYSARYAGEPGDDDANNARVLEDMRDVAGPQRSARFVSTFVLAFPEGSVQSSAGEVTGTIAPACAGTHGFGYDAVFIPDGHDATFGVLGLEVKRGISHRSRALQAMVPLLRDALAGCGSAP